MKKSAARSKCSKHSIKPWYHRGSVTGQPKTQRWQVKKPPYKTLANREAVKGTHHEDVDTTSIDDLSEAGAFHPQQFILLLHSPHRSIMLKEMV